MCLVRKLCKECSVIKQNLSNSIGNMIANYSLKNKAHLYGIFLIKVNYPD